MDKEELREVIKESIEEIFFSEEEFSPFNSLQDKINKLLNVSKYEQRLDISVSVCDKFEDYMKNIDRLNQMINEFKGLVSMLRGEASEVKKHNHKQKDMLKKLLVVLSVE